MTAKVSDGLKQTPNGIVHVIARAFVRARKRIMIAIKPNATPTAENGIGVTKIACLQIDGLMREYGLTLDEISRLVDCSRKSL